MAKRAIERAGWVLGFFLGLAGLFFFTQLAETSTSNGPDAATKVKVQAAYGKLPLHFEANQGQSDGQVKFLSRGNGYTLFLAPTEAVLVLRKPHKNSLAPVSGERARARGLDPGQTEQMVLRMRLTGANPSPQVAGLDELPGKSNYFIGNDPKKWRTGIPHYAEVKYERIYPGIDLVFYGNQRQLEYDFVVAPGADPRAIKLVFEGADKVETDTQGDLVLQTAGGELRLHKPRIYQESNGVREFIEGRYVLLGPETSDAGLGTQRVGFQVTAYDASRHLIIDPVLSYSTYLGGSDFDKGNAIAVDTSGNAYVTGDTFSTDFPAVSALQGANGGNSDAFVAKINTTGSALVYSTYLGGNDYDYGYGIAVDSSGNAYVTGITNSTNFPTTVGAFDKSFNGGGDLASFSGDAFVAKLDASGSALVYSTYLGGSDDAFGGSINFDRGYGIAVDSSGNAYVTGETNSIDFPMVNPFQATNHSECRACANAFVTKLNPTGSALVYSTYLGGSIQEFGNDIAVDASGNAYVTGGALSSDFPTTTGAFQVAKGGGDFSDYDAFVTKLNAAGSALVYSTYLGGSDFDEGHDIAVDSLGNAYVTGSTGSTDFPTENPSQAGLGGGFYDAFVTKLNPTGSALVYSTYLGGSSDDHGVSITVDSSGNAYVAGSTFSTNFPTASPFQAIYAFGGDAFVTKLNATGSSLIYSTYLGGSGDDSGYAIAVDSSGNAYVTGSTDSTDFPTASPLQGTNGGGIDAFIAKIAEEVELDHTAFQPRPIPLGVSGGNIDECSAGTLGALVEREEEGQTKFFILSNNHVLALTNTANIGDDIIQPGRYDADTDPSPDECPLDPDVSPYGVVADLTEFEPIKLCSPPDVILDVFLGTENCNKIDAAIAEIREGQVDTSGTILEIGIPGSEPVAPEVGMAVKKSGRTTGVTHGIIEDVNAVIFVTGQWTFYTNQIRIVGTDGSLFSQSGDSGSLVVEDVDSCPPPVGLLFAGNKKGEATTNPIQGVLDTFGVTVVGCPVATSTSTQEPGGESNIPTIKGPRPDKGAVAKAMEVQERHNHELLNIPGVVGTGVGFSRERGQVVIRVYVEEQTPDLEQLLPRVLESVPVEIVETGRFYPL